MAGETPLGGVPKRKKSKSSKAHRNQPISNGSIKVCI